MAFTEFYVQTTGSNLNSGSSTSDTAVYTSTNGSWNSGTGVFTPTSGNPSLSVNVGDFASVFLDAASVTGFVGRVTAVSSTTITISITAKAGTVPTTAGTGLTCKVGGAWKGPTAATSFPFAFLTSTLTNASVDYPRANFKSGTTYLSAGAMSHNGTLATFQGYATTLGDGGKAIINCQAGFGGLSVSGANNAFVDLIVYNVNGASTFTGAGAGNLWLRCVAHDGSGGGFVFTGDTLLVECESYANSGGGFSCATVASTYLRCIAHDNSGAGFSTTVRGANYINCIAETNTGSGFLITGATAGAFLRGCDAYNNANGVTTSSGTGIRLLIESCNFIKNTTYGVGLASSGICRIVNCGFGTGSQANGANINVSATGITVTETGSVNYPSNVTPWNDPDNGDFSITLAGAKGTGRGAFTETATSYAGTTSYPDIGSAQHFESPSDASAPVGIPSIR